MSTKSCSIKMLPPHQWIVAARTAVQTNPANAPALGAIRMAFPGSRLESDQLALLTSKYWGAKGVRLTVGFLDNPPASLRTRILSSMNAWGSFANVEFSETATSPQVRIARTANDGYWSYLGTDILLVPASEPTMNLDSFTTSTADSAFHQVVRHETGHTLGFPHEHLRVAIVQRIDPEKAIAYFSQTQGWTAQMVRDQVLTPIDQSALLATAEPDPNSIMCYWLPGSIMKDGVGIDGGLDINAQDGRFAATVYPGAVTPTSIWPNGKAYLFKGNQYTRYDVAKDKVDRGFPLLIAGRWPGFPAEFTEGLDASVLWSNGKAYFFKGSQYVRYDIAADSVDAGFPQPIAAQWPGLWPDSIDAAVFWPTGKAYFFRGPEYIRYDVATNKTDPGFPRPIKAGWPDFPDAFAQGIDAALMWNNGSAYFFKNDQYLRYEIARDKVYTGFPKPIAGHWPGLWASCI